MANEYTLDGKTYVEVARRYPIVGERFIPADELELIIYRTMGPAIYDPLNVRHGPDWCRPEQHIILRPKDIA